MVAAIKMQSVAERQQFEADIKYLRDHATDITDNLGALERIADDRKTVKRTRAVTLEAARRLDRIKRDGAYIEKFGLKGWDAFCRSIKYAPRTVRRLLNLLDVTDSLSDSERKKLGEDGLSLRQASEIMKMPEEDREAIIDQAAQEGNTSPSNLRDLREQKQAERDCADDPDFHALRETLKASAPRTPKLDEGEAPRKTKAPENWLASMQRQLTSLQNQFNARGKGEIAQPLIDQLLTLAQACVTPAA